MFWKTIFWPLVGAAPEIFHVPTKWPKLANTHPLGTGSPTIFYIENSTNGPKFSLRAPVTLGLGGVTLGNFPCHVPRGRHVNLSTTFGADTPEIW